MPLCGWTGEKKVLDDAARRAAPGSFMQLARGFTHYENNGPHSLRPVVLVHGFSVPYFIWDPTVQALRGAGLRSIRYDLYGRGYSDRPDTAYDLALFLGQLLELLDASGCAEADLVGLSMGGPIAASLAVAYPERVRKLVLIDPSGVEPIALGALRGLAGLPGIGTAFLGLTGSTSLLNTIAADFYEPALVAAFRDRYRVQMEYRGFARAVISTIRHGMLDSFASTYSRLGDSRKEVLLIWGEEDSTIPFDHSRTLLGLVPHAEFLPVPLSGHVPHYERPDIVNPRLLEFLH